MLLRPVSAIHFAVSCSHLRFIRVRALRKVVGNFETVSNLPDTGKAASSSPYKENDSALEFQTKSINPSEPEFGNLRDVNWVTRYNQLHRDRYLAKPNRTTINVHRGLLSPLKIEFCSQPIISDSARLTKIDNLHQINLSSLFDRIAPENPPELIRHFPPAFNLSAYINESMTLQHLIQLGVDLSNIEKRRGLLQFILKLDFERDIKPHLCFLTDLGISPELLGDILAENPLIFKEDLGDLEVRVNYMEVKNFKISQIVRIVSKNPFWLMYSTKHIDKRLGYFQKNFRLSGNDVRFLASKQPRLVTYSMEHIRHSTFCIREEMGFNKDEVKCLLLSKPKLWMMDYKKMAERFEFIHQQMNISHHQIIQFPEILISRLFRLKERHGFLKYLGKAQYDPSKDLYISLKKLVEGSDPKFVIDTAKASIEEYNTYLRSS